MSGGVLIMAGGTGGHIFPGLAVASALRERSVPLAWLGAEGGMESELVPAASIEFHAIRVERLRGQGLTALLLAPFRLARSVLQAARVIRRVSPAAVLSMGGFVAGPGGLAAWLLRKPVVVHEQNRIPGLTNRVLSKLARRVLTGFPDTFPAAGQPVVVGNPVRREISALPPPASRLAERSGRPRLLILGGSQGARRLNEVLPAAVATLPPELKPEIRHQVGRAHVDAAREAWAEVDVTASIEPFIDDMAAAYGWADLVVARAGALTIAELAAAGVGALLVPFPYAVDDHQTRNAAFLVEAGAAELLPEKSLDGQVLGARLAALFADREKLLDLAVAARSVARPDAAARAAEHCLEVAR